MPSAISDSIYAARWRRLSSSGPPPRDRTTIKLGLLPWSRRPRNIGIARQQTAALDARLRVARPTGNGSYLEHRPDVRTGGDEFGAHRRRRASPSSGNEILDKVPTAATMPQDALNFNRGLNSLPARRALPAAGFRAHVDQQCRKD